MPYRPLIVVPTPVVTAVLVSPAAARTPTTPPPAVGPSAPNTSSVPSISTLPLTTSPSTTSLLSANTVGPSSLMAMVSACGPTGSPSLSVATTLKTSNSWSAGPVWLAPS
ncbi:hypothetical protein D3C78_937710 [compost metagenome]